ncbi:MAG TPA: DUF1918 domain-containing protein [Actinomycetota bacterium]|nr:DUF1918 domain-containing protein [Actinomycetota bacterium]
MPKPGDRVVVEGLKVGGGRREGTLVETVGSLIKVRWTDGGETIMAPGAGAVRFLPGSAKAAKSSGSSAKKATAKAAKPAAKKGAKKR